jgi:hypothetical protein
MFAVHIILKQQSTACQRGKEEQPPYPVEHHAVRLERWLENRRNNTSTANSTTPAVKQLAPCIYTIASGRPAAWPSTQTVNPDRRPFSQLCPLASRHAQSPGALSVRSTIPTRPSVWPTLPPLRGIRVIHVGYVICAIHATTTAAPPSRCSACCLCLLPLPSPPVPSPRVPPRPAPKPKQHKRHNDRTGNHVSKVASAQAFYVSPQNASLNASHNNTPRKRKTPCQDKGR